MKPEETSSSLGGTPLLQQRPILSDTEKDSHENIDSREAASKILRNKIDTLFAEKTALENHPYNQAEPFNPYDRKYTDQAEQQTTNDWNKYHSAWQNYYQKYYEGYYSHHLQKAKESLIDEKTAKEEAEYRLKQKLFSKIKESANKIRKSRHFMPLFSGVVAMLLFLFLQYNTLLVGSVMAYVSPGYINPQNIIIDPSTDITVSPDPRIIVPKINVDTPVHYDIGNDYNSQMKAMDNGVAHFAVPGASSHPGEIGNTVIAGHSSSDLFGSGDYKFIFSQLEKLEKGDTVYANYNSKRYTYVVTGKQVVGPNDVSSLVYATDKPILTLLTCVPVGTANSRLLVIAEQISPDPSQSKTSTPVSSSSSTSTSIPGNQPTIFERLFGTRN
jgi:sortase A